jgi:alkylation response protein AidB-like acyl-CoA dehydrogenase
MNFDFSEEQKLLQKTARDYLTEHCTLAQTRAVLESDRRYDESLWKGVAEMGWLGAAVPESYGGAGFGALELSLIALELGRALAPIPFGPSVYVVTEALLAAGSDAQKQRWLPRLASGDAIGAFALVERPGRARPDQLTTRFENGKLTGVKTPVQDGAAANLLLVAAREGARTVLVLVETSDAKVGVSPIGSIDPSRPLAKVSFDGARAETLGGGGDDKLLSHLLDRAATLTAFEQIGGAERALELTRQFTLGRYAFGRPVASFQALKHRMADVYAAIALATSHAYYAAWALSSGAPELATAAAAARAAASDALELAATEMIQMYGGVGYTWEYDCHLFYRRAKQLGLWLGSAAEWRDELVERLATARA